MTHYLNIERLAEEQAVENVTKWGLQDPEVILLAIMEELGELTQAYLEWTYEDGDLERIDEELIDLAALLYQLHWSMRPAWEDQEEAEA